MSEEYVLDRPPTITCPECGGALKKIESDPFPKYVCHIGHVLSGEAMLQAQAERIEYSLTNALALLNERRELCREMLDDGPGDSVRLQRLFSDASGRAEKLRELLNEHGAKPAMNVAE
ncbi:MAG TPA: hypothetical protein VKW08_22855 [Xanthobacteraceae bacterium]|nr:hypothetical protein [Xanthobacteraceae bacterium]